MREKEERETVGGWVEIVPLHRARAWKDGTDAWDLWAREQGNRAKGETKRDRRSGGQNGQGGIEGEEGCVSEGVMKKGKKGNVNNKDKAERKR